MKKDETLSFKPWDYRECYSFEKLIGKSKNKSEEVYFGMDNPLRTGLIFYLSKIKELITDAREKNPSIRGLALIEICKDEFENLSNVIKENFNIEKCAIGFQNAINAACFPQIYNKKLAGLSDSSNKMRIKLDDIVETKNGFRYKDGKGIYYAVCIGLQFFYDDTFTVPEIASIVVHELGHAMQHIVHDINANFAISYWASIMRALDTGLLFKCDLNNKTKNILEIIKKSHYKKDYENITRIGKEILDDSNPEDLLDFDKLDSHELTSICNDETPIDGSDIDTLPKKKNIVARTVIGMLKSILSVVFLIFLVPLIVGLKLHISKKKMGLRLNDEITADAFEVFYGFGSEAGEAMRKLSKYHSNRGDMGLINYIPLLNLWKCYSDIHQEYIQMIFGYPSIRQRIINAYINCDFEIRTNKDLSEEAKKELQEQINSLKETYDHFVRKNDTRGGFIYKVSSIIGSNTLEKAAKKDPTLKDQVLEPLKKKRDEGVFK
jgi:hypothetical protein